MSYSDFSSLPPEQEESFVVFERTSRESAKSAKVAGYLAGGLFFLLVVVIVFAFAPAEKSHASAEEHSLGAEKVETNEAPKPVAEEKAAEEEGAIPETEAAAADATESDATAQADEKVKEAPKPPPGATKAPPTALIGQ